MTDLELNKKALEQAAFNLCSLHGFPFEFVASQERFAKAAICEYLTAMQEAEFVTPTIETIGGEVKTLRDECAMAALYAIVSKVKAELYDVDEVVDTYGEVARGAYEYADAMLKARAE
jgi:hypothetical protein